MRKESLKKSSTNGAVEDANVENDAEVNGSVPVDADDADPLQGADQPALEIPKKKGRKKVETVTEVAIPLAKNNDDGDNSETDQSVGSSRKRPAAKEKSTASVVPEKRSRSKIATSTTVDNASSDDDAENGDGEYEVEAIVDHKIVRGKTSFLIRWKNYDASGDTWEPESSLSCPEIITNYREEHMKDVEFKPKRKRESKPKTDKKEKEYEVQLIYDEKMEGGVKHYLVRWKGYKMDDDTWDPEDSLNCPELISKYNDSKKNKRTSGVRGTPKKLTYTEIDETEGEDDKRLYVNGSSSKTKSKSKAKSAPVKGKKGAGRPKSQTQKEDDYEVEDIVGEKIEGGKKYYFLKWKGWPSSNNTWELASSLNCPDILKKYQAKLKIDLKSPKSTAKAAPKSKSGTKSTKTTASKSKSPAKKTKTSKPPKSKPATKAAKKQTVDVDEDWEVEKVIDVQYNVDGTKNFLIRWKGCDPSQDTWEPEHNVNSPDLVNEFMNTVDDDDDVPIKKKSRKV